jgi:acetyltransferase
MTIRNLHHALEPRSVALFGASERPGARGTVVLANLVAGGFEGPLWPVNPRHATVQGLCCFADAAALPGAPDLAVIAAPARAVPGIVAAVAERGTRAAVVVTDVRDPSLRSAMLEAARPKLMRLIGPDSAGLMVPSLGLNAGLGAAMARPGKLALVSQSGAIAATLVEWSAGRGLGFSHVVSLGGMADADVGDYLDLLAGDRRTTAILCYLETIPAPRKFMSAARAAARLKPVVAIKAGRHPAAAAAAATHAGALVGADAVVEAALRRAGVLRVTGLGDLFDAAEVMGRFRPLDRGRLGIVTNAGGAGVLAADRLIDMGGAFAAIAPETIAGLDAVLPAGWSRANPVDIDGDAPPERYVAALRALAADPGVDALLAMNCPTGLADPRAAARAVAEATERGMMGRKPVLSCWLGGAQARAARSDLREAGIASYDTPATAAAAAAHLTDWGRAQAALLRVPDRGDADQHLPARAREKVAAILAGAAEDGRRLLSPGEAMAVLEAYGVSVCPTHEVADATQVEAAADELLAAADGVAVKLLSRAITHKSAVGGVMLNLDSAATAGEAALAIAARVAARRPDATVDGFLVQPMVRRPDADELILGIGQDRVFGPVLLFGAGGIKVEALRDTAVALPPLDRSLAAELVARTRIGAALGGRSGSAGVDAIHGALVALSNLVEDFPCIRGLDVNPLLADLEGVIAVDGRIEIEPGDVERRGPNPDFAIRPYPAAWTTAASLGGENYTFRAIRPTDAFLYPDFLTKLDPEAIRMRFLAPRKHFPDDMGLRLSQLDYDRDMAFVALDPTGALAGVARLACQPGNEAAEYALIVRSDLGGRGLGSALMRHLIAYAKAEGMQRIEGSVLAENRAMLGLIARLGFTIERDPDDASLVMSRLML